MTDQHKEVDYNLWISTSKKLDEQTEILDKGDGMSGVMSYGVTAFFWIVIIFVVFYSGVGFLESFLISRDMSLPDPIKSILFCLTLLLSGWVLYFFLSRKKQLNSVPEKFRNLIIAMQNLEENASILNPSIYKQIKVLNERLETYFSSNVTTKHELALIICMRVSNLNQLPEMVNDMDAKAQVVAQLAAIKQEVVLLQKGSE